MKPHSKGDAKHSLVCEVRLLHDEKALIIEYPKTGNGDWLLDYVCKDLDLLEKYYFGIRITEVDHSRSWLQLDKPLRKQIKACSRKQGLHFRVRYYPSSPSAIHEDITRYYLFYQLRRDSYHGRLVMRPNDIPYFTALILQSELGDYEDVELQEGFLDDVEYLPKLASSMEDRIIEQYQSLCGLTPSQAERQFIEKAFPLDSYGIDFKRAKIKDKEMEGEFVHIGVSYLGVSIFQAFRRLRLFRWSTLHKIAFSGKLLTLIVTHADVEKSSVKKVSHRYKCDDPEDVWMTIKDQQAFFTLDKHDDAKPSKSGGLFSRSSKFRFSGRVQSEVSFDSSHIMRSSPMISRSTSTLDRSTSIRSGQRLSLNLTSDSLTHIQSLPLRDCSQNSQSEDSGLTIKPDIFVEEEENEDIESGSSLTTSTPSRQGSDAGPTQRHTDHYNTPKLIITKPSNSEAPEDLTPPINTCSDEDEVLVSEAQAMHTSPEDDNMVLGFDELDGKIANETRVDNDSESDPEEYFVSEENITLTSSDRDKSATVYSKTEIEFDDNILKQLELTISRDVQSNPATESISHCSPRRSACPHIIKALLYSLMVAVVVILASSYILYGLNSENELLEKLRRHNYIQTFNATCYSPAKKKASEIFSYIVANYL